MSPIVRDTVMKPNFSFKTFTRMKTSNYKFASFTLLVILGCVTSVQTYRILCPFPTISQSHFIVVEALMIGLAEKGHNVTVISPHPPAVPVENYRHILNPRSNLHATMMGQFLDKPGSLVNTFKAVPHMLEFGQNEIRTMLQNSAVKRILETEIFDLVLVEGWLGDPLLGLGQHFNCPIVQLSSVRASNYFLDLYKNPIGIAYARNGLAEYAGPMDFRHRVYNMFLFLVQQPFFVYSTYAQNKFYNELFPKPKFRTFHEARQNVSAVFVAQHFTDVDIRPLAPTIIEIGGIHLKDKMNPLPAGLQEWMDKSIAGVILFSLGSNMKCSLIAPDKLNIILGVFKQLQENVLWKCEVNDMIGKPENVKMMNWLPQTDILQHNNTKLFVTHGGQGSVSEAKFYGVPLIVVSLFADQMANGFQVEHDKWGINLRYLELTNAKLFSKIREVIDNPDYKREAKYRSSLYRDRPLTPLETGVFWTEYIIRHRGAKHMQPNSMYLNFFQLQSLDVLGFLILITVIVSFVNYNILIFVFHKIVRRFNKSKVD